MVVTAHLDGSSSASRWSLSVTIGRGVGTGWVLWLEYDRRVTVEFLVLEEVEAGLELAGRTGRILAVGLKLPPERVVPLVARYTCQPSGCRRNISLDLGL